MSSGVGSGGRNWARVLPIALGTVLSISGCDNSPFGTLGTTTDSGPTDDGSVGDDAGTGDSGTGPEAQCPDISFVNPVAGRVLDESSDVDADNCENGFQYDVVVATSAAEGTPAVLYAGSTQVGTTTVKGAVLSFDSVQLTSSGRSELKVQVGAQNGCTAKRAVDVSCSVPSCTITKPVVSATHPALNGLPAANGGDRVSAEGAPYQVLVEVATSVETGQPVELLVNGAVVGLTALAEDGKAVFAGVTLTPDGEHVLEAVCRGKSGLAGRSAKATYGVDTTPPALTVVEPLANAHFEEAETFRVCGTSSSADASNLPEALGTAAQRNFCASVGGAVAVCDAAQGAQGDACVDLPCPGGPPFDVKVSLRDLAGNVQSTVVPGISCRVGRLGAEIIAPVSSVSGNPATNVLASTAAQALRDLDGAQPGAQTHVRACTDAVDATMSLSAGLASGVLSPVGEPVAVELATVNDGCPAGKPYIARFNNVTLPESAENAAGALLTSTRLVVDVTDESGIAGTSLPVDLWVDSARPLIGSRTPNPLCGHVIQGATPTTQLDVTLLSSVVPFDVTLTHPGGTLQIVPGTSYTSGTNVNLGQIMLSQGATNFAATLSEPSGNTASLPVPCTVTYGNPPVVTWLTPAAGGKLNASNDADPVTPGWQGTLKARTDLGAVVPRATVQFSTATNGNLGGPVEVDSNGDASLAVTLPEGSTTQIIATTSNVDGRGIGRAFLVLPVDTTTPPAVSQLRASVPENLRRQTSFLLQWTSPDDAGQAVKTYDVRVSTTPITDITSFNAATLVTYLGSPAQPGLDDSALVTDRLIEQDYYFGVIAQDAGGNRSLLATAGPARASFKSTILTGSGGASEQFGRALDGSADLNGDGFADLVVGAGNGSEVAIYFGAEAGYAQTPSVRITAPAGFQFGLAVEVVGDIDGDGRLDLAIGAPQDGDGAVYVFRGRDSWPATLPYTRADYVITVNASEDPGFSGGLFGGSLARVGDYDGDGADDFAIGASRYSSNLGYTAVVRGVRAGTGPFPTKLSLSVPNGRFTATPGSVVNKARFGWALAGLGKFYPGGGTSLLVSGYLYSRVYAFAGLLNAESPADLAVWPDTTLSYGASIAALGALGSPMAVGVGLPAFTKAGSLSAVLIHRGTAATGPLVSDPVKLTNAAASATGNSFGSCVLGSLISGVNASYGDNKGSFIGSTLPDVAVSGLGEGTGPAKLYIIDGQKVPALVSGDIASAADISVSLPEDWVGNAGCMPQSRAIRDLNNDGYADLSIARYQASGAYPGGVLVLW